ncbi:MAG TPA: hypothetical protein VH969_14225 [Actinophytocola sp.]|uniref:phosphoribosylanthranilate isomerase n=1 Tax=Actinophytocola sp. TaxID=1872138 RepID=UPI002F9240C8
MSPPLLKVCGARSAPDVALLAAAGADLVGLWHGVPGGHAELPLADLGSLAGAARSAGLTPVLVTFASDAGQLADVLARTGIRWVQLHAFQLPATVAALHAAVDGLTVVKVLHVRSGACLERPLVGGYERAGTDLFLLDTMTEQGRVGSTGRRLAPADALAVAGALHRPFLLAGGLSADNAGDFAAVAAQPNYAGIDVDTAARDGAGRFAAGAVTGLARAWRTARHSPAA